MPSIPERIAIQLSRKNRRAVAAAAVVLGAVLSAFAWWLAGARQATGEERGDWVNVLYTQIGVPYPRASLAAAFVIGGAIGFVLIWLVTMEAGAGSPIEPDATLGSAAALEPVAPATETQSASVYVHDRKDQRITVRYPKPFVRVPNLTLDVRGGWASYEILEEEPDKFVFRVTESIGFTTVFWTAKGDVNQE